ncbi:MAG: hypothetical protein NTV63_02940 [Candidatus Woesearchaeota archaeon]|nr:hypothetical protein [Candidatus Woesearchaeota archaeon]
MELREGKYTAEVFASENNLGRQSAINLLSKLKRQGLAEVTGGGKQKRIYTIHKLPKKKTNGFYDMINKYSPEKLQPRFEHYTTGRYTPEQAIIDGINIGDARTLEATAHLFNQVASWKRLFFLAKKNKLEKQMITLYKKARETIRCRRMPERYLK